MKRKKLSSNLQVLADDKQWLTKEEVFFLLGKMDHHRMQVLRNSQLIRWQYHPFYEKKFLYNKTDIIKLLNDTSKMNGQAEQNEYIKTPDVKNW